MSVPEGWGSLGRPGLQDYRPRGRAGFKCSRTEACPGRYDGQCRDGNGLAEPNRKVGKASARSLTTSADRSAVGRDRPPSRLARRRHVPGLKRRATPSRALRCNAAGEPSGARRSCTCRAPSRRSTGSHRGVAEEQSGLMQPCSSHSRHPTKPWTHGRENICHRGSEDRSAEARRHPDPHMLDPETMTQGTSRRKDAISPVSRPSTAAAVFSTIWRA
jgi:hypothetical protein